MQLPLKPPPVVAAFESGLHMTTPGAGPAAAPQRSPWNLFRASDGKLRVDTGNASVISDPGAQQITTLDHLKKEYTVIPMSPGQPPQLPAGGAPTAPQMKLLPDVKDLGKRTIAGQEAEGKLYTFQAPKMPQLQIPKLPQMPKAPQPSAAPQPPSTPGPSTLEVWHSTKLHLPLMSKLTGGSGQYMSLCKQASPGEPPPSAFQVPAGYKPVPPPSPIPTLPIPKLEIPKIQVPKLQLPK